MPDLARNRISGSLDHVLVDPVTLIQWLSAKLAGPTVRAKRPRAKGLPFYIQPFLLPAASVAVSWNSADPAIDQSRQRHVKLDAPAAMPTALGGHGCWVLPIPIGGWHALSGAKGVEKHPNLG